VALARGYHDLLSLPHLLARTYGRKPLVDYFQSYVVTSREYLRIMRQKAMDREATNHIRESKREEKQEKQAKETLIMLTTTKRLITCKTRTNNFIVACSSLTIRKVGEKIHYNLKVGL
jgi:hypothetical protein